MEKKRRWDEEGGKEEDDKEERRGSEPNGPGEVPASVLPAVKLPMLQHSNAQPSTSKPPLDLTYRPTKQLGPLQLTSDVLGGFKLVCISAASHMSLASCKKRKHANEMSQTTLPTPNEQPSLLSLALNAEGGLLRKRKGTNWSNS